MTLAVGTFVRLRTRALYAVNQPTRVWSYRLYVSEDVCDGLAFWQQNVAALNGRSIWLSSSVTRVAYSDHETESSNRQHSHADNPLIAHLVLFGRFSC